MVDQNEFGRWREAANGAQQSAQFAIKGLLHGIGAGAWGHDLVVLGRALAAHTGKALPDEIAAALRRLSRHYIPARYPDAHPSGPPGAYYGGSDAEQALTDPASTLEYVDRLWSAWSTPTGGDEDAS